MFISVAPSSNARAKISGKSNTCIERPGFDLIQSLHNWLAALLNGLKTHTSSGCRRWLQCGGNDKMWIPFARQNFSTSRLRCETWLSNNNKIGCSIEHRVNSRNFCTKSRKRSLVIKPDGLAPPQQGFGPLFKKCGWNRARGKIRYGGALKPAALTAKHIETSWPRSLDVICPTCFRPRRLMTRSGLCTVVRPVSSTFHMFCGLNVMFALTLSNRSKNEATLCRLKADARAKLVASGLRIDSFGWRRKNPSNQSGPAISFFFQFSGIFFPVL